MRGKVDQDATKCTAGDTIIASSNSSVVDSTSGVYVKLKEIKVLLTGTIRVAFTGSSSGAASGLLIVYKNGSQVSSTLTWMTATPTAYAYDVPVNSGDLLQLTGLENSGYPITASNFSVKFNLSQYATVNL